MGDTEGRGAWLPIVMAARGDPDVAVAVTSQAPYRLYAGPMRGKLR